MFSAARRRILLRRDQSARWSCLISFFNNLIQDFSVFVVDVVKHLGLVPLMLTHLVVAGVSYPSGALLSEHDMLWGVVRMLFFVSQVLARR